MTPAEQRDRLIAAIEDHRNTQGDEAGCTTGAELELWGVLETVKAELIEAPDPWPFGTPHDCPHCPCADL
jgi:hypothetical protein